MTSTGGRRILFVANSERGQCGVFFATMEALLRSNPGVDLHFASFPCLEDETRALSDVARNADSSIKPITFHSLPGRSSTQAGIDGLKKLYGEGATFPPPYLTRPLSISTTMAAVAQVIPVLMPWEGPEFMEIYEFVTNAIKTATPDLVIVDALLAPAVTAAWNSGIRFSYLCPNALKDFAFPYQPLEMLWNFPSLMTGYSYPVPWHQKPMNIFQYFHLLYQASTNPDFAKTRKYVEEQTGKPMRTLLDKAKTLPDFVKFFISSLPELDFPLKSHSRIVTCGPIIRDAPPISESDPELAAWLTKGSTIYVNMGSLFRYTEKTALELARSLNLVLEELDRVAPQGPRAQVLWKLASYPGDVELAARNSAVWSVFGDKLDDDRVRIVSWLESSPLAILRSGKIGCSVHHGGASSYNEAVLSGVPHVILPFWSDCYEYANRVEFLGIGRQGSQKQQPAFEAAELSGIILEVMNGESSSSMRNKALELAEICKQHGDGPQIAAQGILKLAVESAAASSEEIA